MSNVPIMRACVLGGGPSGIFVSRYLQNRGIEVDLLEKSSTLLGNYKYARSKIDLIKDLKANVQVNSDENSIDDTKYNFYVVSSGGKPKELEISGKEHVLNAMDVIINYHAQSDIGRGETCSDAHSRNEKIDELLKNQHQKICIVGMGNVALDLAYYLKDNAKSITIINRSGIEKAPFDNYVMREVIGSFYPTIVSENTMDLSNISDRKTRRRVEMIQHENSLFAKLLKYIKSLISIKPLPRLNLVFNSYPQKILQRGKRIEMNYFVENTLKTDVFDAVISSIGFVPNDVKIKTSKPVYYSGWCVRPRGNIGDAMIDANNTVNHILNKMGKHTVV